MGPNRAAQPKRARARAANGDAESDSITRQRVIDAAVETIVDNGFALASSREILKRAGFTWGVLQYHFGSREDLLLAVLHDAYAKFGEAVSNASMRGASLEERVKCYLEFLDGIYGSPPYLAALEIILNLSRDPATRAETLKLLHDVERQQAAEVQRLAKEVLGAAAKRDHIRLLFQAARGYSLSTLLANVIEYGDAASVTPKQKETDRQKLARALAVVLAD